MAAIVRLRTQRGAVAVVSAACAAMVLAADREPAPRGVPSRRGAAATAARSEGSTRAATEKSEVRSTVLDIELIAGDATSGLDSQNWGRVFDELGRTVRIRSGDGLEEPAVTEVVRGTLRTVTLVGRLDRGGLLAFPGRKFKSTEEQPLKEYLDERELYGARGSPEGQPLWGLDREQFTRLFATLSAPLEAPAIGRPLSEVAGECGLGTDVPLRIRSDAERAWNVAGPGLVALQEVRGLSHGTAMAVLLADHGLCVCPTRTPAGVVEMVIRARGNAADGWPIGWEPKADVRRTELFPELFAFRPIGFLERPLPAILDDAESQTGVVIVVDAWAAAQHKIDLENCRYGLSKKKTAWTIVLSSAVEPSGLQTRYRIDEGGRGFLWLTPFEPSPATR